MDCGWEFTTYGMVPMNLPDFSAEHMFSMATGVQQKDDWDCTKSASEDIFDELQ